MPPRGHAFARYLRKVQIEYCPFKPKAVAPIFFQEIHTKQIKAAMPKLEVSKKIMPAPAGESLSFIDRARLTFVDGSEKVYEFEGMSVRDVLEQISSDNVAIQQKERQRGKAFT